MSRPRVEAFGVPESVRSALSGIARPVLAVSGGLDSMVLLHAAGERRQRNVAPVVATFDHGTGRAATRAVALVARTALELGFECVIGKAADGARTEEAWRRARWEFLREVAAETGGAVVTAHTLDDQIETIFMRILRGAGPRGLAALYASSDVVRPLIAHGRADLERYAAQHGVRYAVDPSNENRRYLRNRVRHDLLPAISLGHPRFPGQLLDIARRSAEWRGAMESLLDTLDASETSDGSLRVARSSLAGYDSDSLRVLWPALAARAHVVMDRRGTQRAAEFTMRGTAGRSIQLSGRIEIVMHRDHLLLRRWASAAASGTHA